MTGALIKELKIMTLLDKHENIVNLLGAVTDEIGKSEYSAVVNLAVNLAEYYVLISTISIDVLMMIVEYCQFGNVRDFQLKNRGLFIVQTSTASSGYTPLGQKFDIIPNSSTI